MTRLLRDRPSVLEMADGAEETVYHAALINTHLEWMGHSSYIEFQLSQRELYIVLIDNLAKTAKLLLEQHWEEVAACDLDSLRDPWNKYLPTKDESIGMRDIERLLECLIAEDKSRLETADCDITSQQAYKLIDHISDCCMGSIGDYVQVPLIGPLPQFSRELLPYWASCYDEENPPDDFTSRWLGRLSVLAFQDDWKWKKQAASRMMVALIKEFNERFGY